MNETLALQFVNYHTGDYLKDAIESVRQDLARSSVGYSFYVWNNSPDEDLGWLNDVPDTRVESGENVGFGSGHNKLLALHDADVTLMLNPDIKIIEPHTIMRMIDSFRREPKTGCLGVRLVGSDRQQQAWDHGELDTSRRADSPTSDYRERHEKGEVAWVSGADSLLLTSAVKAIGGFDEHFFLYKEEEDLCLRLRQNGLTTYYDPSISIMHHGSVVASKDDAVFGKSVDYFNTKHGL